MAADQSNREISHILKVVSWCSFLAIFEEIFLGAVIVLFEAAISVELPEVVKALDTGPSWIELVVIGVSFLADLCWIQVTQLLDAVVSDCLSKC